MSTTVGAAQAGVIFAGFVHWWGKNRGTENTHACMQARTTTVQKVVVVMVEVISGEKTHNAKQRTYASGQRNRRWVEGMEKHRKKEREKR